MRRLRRFPQVDYCLGNFVRKIPRRVSYDVHTIVWLLWPIGRCGFCALHDPMPGGISPRRRLMTGGCRGMAPFQAEYDNSHGCFAWEYDIECDYLVGDDAILRGGRI